MPNHRPRRPRRRSPQHLRTVYVCQYTRYRFGHWEQVRFHYRSPPGTQLAFDF